MSPKAVMLIGLSVQKGTKIQEAHHLSQDIIKSSWFRNALSKSLIFLWPKEGLMYSVSGPLENRDLF